MTSKADELKAAGKMARDAGRIQSTIEKATKPKAKKENNNYLYIRITDEQADYINTMARLAGLSKTDFILSLLDKSKKKNAALFEQAKELQKNFK